MADQSRGEPRDKKRKWTNAKQQYGGRNQKKDLGRGAWSRSRMDKRTQNEESTAKRQKAEQDGESKPSVLPKPFTQEEIDAEGRKPKHKVAVMIGYSGSGYRGMQINTTERTIEGDLFTAFVGSGAISKANANDPKKSGLVRCARTDKGVHAAGNVVSIKLILEDPHLVKKLNDLLSPQIRIWGIQRTVGSFSCYQACDSRWYEYLIPSHAFLPPHPSSFMSKSLIELAEQAGDLKGYQERQEEVQRFWAETEQNHIKPILDELNESTKEIVLKALYDPDSETEPPEAPEVADSEALVQNLQAKTETAPNGETPSTELPAFESATNRTDQPGPGNDGVPASVEGTDGTVGSDDLTATKRALDTTVKRLRAAYIRAKRSYRIDAARLARIQPILDRYLGTHAFHNYTIQKSATDPSAKRIIKSFALDPEPKIIDGTEWLSIKIHGQSFMMHQIRKMISAVALIVRSGCSPDRVADTLSVVGPTLSIPKVPGLGLLLERPVFESYNTNTAAKFDREALDFGKFEKEMAAFKQREIYERIFREEEEGNAFHTFFAHVDGFKNPAFLWVTSLGVEATSTTTDRDGAGKGAAASGTGAGGQDGSTRHAIKAGSGKSPANGAVDSEDESDAEESRQRPDTDG